MKFAVRLIANGNVYEENSNPTVYGLLPLTVQRDL